MASTAHERIFELRTEIERYLMEAPKGFAARDEAVEWLMAADSKLRRLAQLQRRLELSDPVFQDWFVQSSAAHRDS